MIEWDQISDVVVVGSGGGGLCGALVARTHGLEALVVEKTSFVGGSTAMSGGSVWLPNNPVMHAAGVPDSRADALTYLDAAIGEAGPASSPSRRQAFVDNAPRLVTFLQELGVPFSRGEGYADYHSELPGGNERGRTIEVPVFDRRRLGPWAAKLRPGMTATLGLVATTPELTSVLYYNRGARGFLTGARVVARTLAGRWRGQELVSNGGALVGWLLERALALETQIWTDAPFQGFILEDGAVVGVTVARGGQTRRIGARRGVLLAAGGFSANADMRMRHGGTQATSADWSLSNPGDTGEVLEAGMALGAATGLLDEAVWTPMPRLPDGGRPAYPPRQVTSFSRMRWRPGTIMVDAAGRRYANESMSYMELGQLMFAHDRETRSVPSWLVFDDACRRRSLFGVLPGRLPEQWVRDGFVIRGQTLAEVAKQCGVDPAGLEATVRRFNELARTGVDTDFHRGRAAADRFWGDPSYRPNGCLAPLERPPFYAVAMYPCDVGTCGGLITDEHARVLRKDGQPIAGLYATGNTTASVTGRHYLGGGGSIGPSCTFGFVAANHIVEGAAGTEVWV